MKKIKSINIQAFRAYKENANFDFSYKETDIADLIVLYAPNGFGKTSFFEAIEWSFSGKLKRFDDNKAAEEQVKHYKENVIRNIYAKPENKTFIEIKTNDNLSLKRERKTRSNSKTGDYTDGKPTKKAAINGQESVDVSLNILSQEKIDDFIRSKNAKQKYDVLKDYWQNENETETFLIVSKTLKKGIDELAELEKELDKKNDEYRKEQEIKDKTKEINTIIEEINAIKVGFDVDNVNIINIKSEELNNIDTKIKEKKSYFQSFINEYYKKNTGLKDLKASFKKHEENLHVLNKAKEKIAENHKIIVKHDLFEKKTKDFNKRSKEIESQTDEYQEIDFLLKNKHGFISLENRINEHSFIENKHIDNILNETKYKQKDYNELLDTKRNELTKIEMLYSELSLKTIDIKENTETLPKLEQRKNDIIKTINNADNNIKELTILIDEKKKLLNFEDYISEEYFELFKDFPVFQDLYDADMKYRGSEMALKEKETDMSNEIENKEKINQILELTLNHIENEEINDCPVCDTPFSEGELKNIIMKKRTSSEKIENIKKGIDILKRSKKYYKEEREKFKITLENNLKEKIRSVNDVLIENQKTYNSEKHELDKINQEIEERKRKLQSIERFLRQEFEVESLAKFSPKQIEDSLTNKKEVLDKEFENLKVKIQYEEKFTIEIRRKKEEINKIKNENLYSDYTKKLHKYEIQPEKITTNTNIIEKRKDEVEIKISHLKNDVINIKDELKRLENELNNFPKRSIEDEISDLENKYKNAQKEIEEYIVKYSELIGHTDISIEVIEKEYQRLLNELETKKPKIEKGIEKLDFIIELLNPMYRILESNLKTKIENLIVEISKLTDVNRELTEAKKELRDFIKKKMDIAFNEDTINSIYKLIDPHPEQKLIRFEPDFDEKDNLKLQIIASDQNEKTQKDPLLYNSSGQINILSVSIFLARALHNESILNTLFMDDPIQFLDGINVLAFIDLLRILIIKHDRQIVISTHDDNFFNLLQRKLDKDYYKARFIELTSYGKIKDE